MARAAAAAGGYTDPAPAPASARLPSLSMPNVNAKFIQNNCILPSDKLSWELQLELELELEPELETELHFVLRAVCDPRALAMLALPH